MIGGVTGIAGCTAGTVSVTPPRPPGIVREACAHLVDYLPTFLSGHRSRVVQPRSPLVHAWGSPPIVLRCGVPKPKGFDPASPQVAQVNGVQWFQVVGAKAVTWTAIRKTADVELVVPTSYQSQGPFLVVIGRSLTRSLP
ncbi:MAG: DUF3515 domain-containing protein [Frankiales bacterium]|nr:DUF3515 domain-containing protein [Frankiales bacterium]